MALHLAASPIATMACVHLAAATENFLAEELLRRHLDPRDPVFFAEMTHWDGESSHDRLWS
ncbi:L-alanine-DL-glutamate epimerase-like enolase superfamily enzyme [Amycolatopsis magusensis]|uniref:L-alanine-DL-glutamate epimerase-like enolase superfamily enzyme n=2 Tax=Amycolatopsis magusensis TaxID=882444 RepID=A0ABS4PYT0_9PSEU|nr:L-alanine-DL-glutamate epimerase-like enolase superfamily enzyme [Amycolatopsis magusensis]